MEAETGGHGLSYSMRRVGTNLADNTDRDNHNREKPMKTLETIKNRIDTRVNELLEYYYPEAPETSVSIVEECKLCGAKFEKYQTRQRFCSPKCKEKYWNTKP